jgi:hypothetical protein
MIGLVSWTSLKELRSVHGELFVDDVLGRYSVAGGGRFVRGWTRALGTLGKMIDECLSGWKRLGIWCLVRRSVENEECEGRGEEGRDIVSRGILAKVLRTAYAR